MNINKLTKRRSPQFRGNGSDADVAVCSRIQLARNLNGFSFVSRATENDLQSIVKLATSLIEKKYPNGQVFVIDPSTLSHQETRLLCERQLVSANFIASNKPRVLILDQSEDFSIMVNEEDHLCFQSTTSGFALSEVWNRIDEIDNLFESELEYAFDDKLGYLTASPSKIGTGLRASVSLHLPALIETGEIPRVARGLQKMNFAICGLFEEGNRALGEIFQIYNQGTLGISEKELIAQFNGTASCIIDYERKARQTMLEKDSEGLLDRCCRAKGVLSSAREMSLEEAMALLSSLRLGARLGILNDLPIDLIDEMQMLSQPAHLRYWADSEDFFENNEAVLRAEYLRERITRVSKRE